MTKQMTVDKHLRAHLKARAKVGASKYGVPLLPFNGRNPLRDKREELLDALVYNEQALMEREQMAVELEEIHGFLYNFRQSREIESADLDRAITALGKMAKRLTEDTERIEPKEEELYIDAFEMPDADALYLAELEKAGKYRLVLPTMFGPDAPPAERQMRAGWAESPIYQQSVPLGPVLESIRENGPIGHRDLLEMAEKHPAMERLEAMECKCCGKCVKA